MPSPDATLHDWKSLRSELLFAFDSPIPARVADVSGQRDGDFSAWLVRRGWAHVWADGESVEAQPGQWLICFGQTITQQLSPDCHLLSLRILQDWPDGSRLLVGRKLYVLEAAAHPRLERVAKQLLRLVGAREWHHHRGLDLRHDFLGKTRLSYEQYARYEFLLHTWLAYLAQALSSQGVRIQMPDTVDPRVLRAVHVLDALPPSADFPQQRLEAVSGLTIGRLNRLFAAAYGHTARAHWELRRFERARVSLTLPQVRVKEIAAQFGFLQLSHFSAWFKRQAGISPRQYRQQALRTMS